jgi:hypothetical protein
MDKLELYTPQTIREIICKRCQNLIGQAFDEQYIQAANMQVFNSFRPICGTCGKPSAAWHPSDVEIDESYQSRLDFQRTILKSLADNEKFKTQKQAKTKKN